MTSSSNGARGTWQACTNTAQQQLQRVFHVIVSFVSQRFSLAEIANYIEQQA